MSLQEELHQAHKARVARMGGMPPRVVRAPVRGVIAVAPPPEPEPIQRATTLRRTPILLKAAWGKGRVGRQPERAPYRGARFWEIKRKVAKLYGFADDDLNSLSRSQPLMSVRHIAVYLVHRHTERSVTQIGKFFGNRDHTTALNSVRKVAVLRETDPVLAAELSYLESIICPEQQNASFRSRLSGANAASNAAASGSARVIDSAPMARADSISNAEAAL